MSSAELAQAILDIEARLKGREGLIAELLGRIETLEQLVTDLCRQRGGVVGIAGGQPKPNERGRI